MFKTNYKNVFFMTNIKEFARYLAAGVEIRSVCWYAINLNTHSALHRILTYQPPAPPWILWPNKCNTKWIVSHEKCSWYFQSNCAFSCLLPNKCKASQGSLCYIIDLWNHIQNVFPFLNYQIKFPWNTWILIRLLSLNLISTIYYIFISVALYHIRAHGWLVQCNGKLSWTRLWNTIKHQRQYPLLIETVCNGL